MLNLSTIRITDVTEGAGWSPARVAELRSLIEVRHFSASEAAAEMRVSRSAVIGKCSREKIQMAKKGHGGRIGPKGGPSQRKVRVKTGRPIAVKPAAAVRIPTVSFTPVCDPIAPGTVRLVDLTGCKYASGSDGDIHLFCDGPLLDGSVYCWQHHNLCYRAMEPRRGGTTPWPRP
jgi:hypothetical protein